MRREPATQPGSLLGSDARDKLPPAIATVHPHDEVAQCLNARSHQQHGDARRQPCFDRMFRTGLWTHPRLQEIDRSKLQRAQALGSLLAPAGTAGPGLLLVEIDELGFAEESFRVDLPSEGFQGRRTALVRLRARGQACRIDRQRPCEAQLPVLHRQRAQRISHELHGAPRPCPVRLAGEVALGECRQRQPLQVAAEEGEMME